MDRVHQLEIEPGMSIDALVKRWSHCGFGRRRLAEAADIYEKCFLEILQNSSPSQARWSGRDEIWSQI